MKKILIYYLLLVFAALIQSCSESSVSIYTFKLDDFNRPASDTILALVETSGSPLLLKGEVELSDGICRLVLINPNADTVYNNLIDVVGRNRVNEEFDRLSGVWKFYYALENFDGNQPAGSIDISLSYSD